MAHPILEKMEKESRLVIGIMSGTSADGVDAALCRIGGHGTDSKVELLGFYFQPYTDEIRREVLRLAGGHEANAADFCRMNFLLGTLYSEAALELCRQMNVKPEQIDLIGSHGQTFWHIPVEEQYCGHTLTSTLQLGEASILTQTFGCPVVSDFRVRDMAAGGQGAPLVPYSEFLIYRSKSECVALQNIGGIGNVTCLLPDCKLEDVFAFDTGPGNMIMDAVISELTAGACRWDEKGQYAAKGTVHPGLLEFMMDDEYIRREPPKTTGREYYGPEYVKKLMAKAKEWNIAGEDLMATVTDFTAQTIAYSLRHFFPRLPDRLVIGGGGSMNPTLISHIRKALPEVRVMTNEEMGYDSNAKESVAFAVMANETLFGGFNNVPSVTGAAEPVVMGKISL